MVFKNVKKERMLDGDSEGQTEKSGEDGVSGSRYSMRKRLEDVLVSDEEIPFY